PRRCRSTSPTLTPRSSDRPTRTPTGSTASTCPREPRSPITSPTSPRSRRRSTTVPAAGPATWHRQNHSPAYFPATPLFLRPAHTTRHPRRDPTTGVLAPEPYMHAPPRPERPVALALGPCMLLGDLVEGHDPDRGHLEHGTRSARAVEDDRQIADGGQRLVLRL